MTDRAEEDGRQAVYRSRRWLRRVVALGVVALSLGSAGVAGAAPPDLFPFVPSDGKLRVDRWYVETSVDGGAYSARLQFPTQVVNGGGTFEIGAGVAQGPPEARTAAAIQVVDGVPHALPAGVRLVARHFGGSAYAWGAEGVARYALTPASGPAVASALSPTCREDNGIFTDEGPSPASARFAPAGTPIGGNVVSTAACGPLGPDATGFASGISTGWQDVIALDSSNAAYFDITGAAPGPATFTARVDPASAIDQGGATGNDTELRALDIPGVVTYPVATVMNTAGSAAVTLRAAVVAPQVRGRRISPASPSDGSDAAPATGAIRFSVVDPPRHGTVQITGARALYASSGGTAADTFTVVAEDSRGLRSALARVFVDPPGSAPRVGLPRPDIFRTALRRSLKFKARKAKVFRVRVRRGEHNARFSVDWRSGRYAVTLRNPKRRLYKRSAGRAVRLVRARTFREFRVRRPAPGVWRLKVVRLTKRPATGRARIRVTLLRKG